MTVAKPPAQPEPVAPLQPADGASPRANDGEQGTEVEQPSATPDRQQVQEAEAPAQAESQGAASQAEAGAAVGTDREPQPAGGGEGGRDLPASPTEAKQQYSRSSYRQAPSRQAKGVRAESLSRTLAGMAANWSNAPQIHVVQSVDELPLDFASR